mgnify:CR=1 FL=1
MFVSLRKIAQTSNNASITRNKFIDVSSKENFILKFYKNLFFQELDNFQSAVLGN